MARAAERGSIISFIVVGIVLTALVVGGIYTAKQLASRSQAPTVAVQNEPEAPSQVQDEQQKDKDAQEAEKKAAAEKAAEAERKAQAEREAQAAKEREAKDKAEAEAAEEADAAADTATGDVDALPQTGPAELVGTGVALAAVTGSVLAYRRSSRAM